MNAAKNCFKDRSDNLASIILCIPLDFFYNFFSHFDGQFSSIISFSSSYNSPMGIRSNYLDDYCVLLSLAFFLVSRKLFEYFYCTFCIIIP